MSHKSRKRKVTERNKEKLEVKEAGQILTTKHIRAIADAFILAIEDKSMSYRDFKIIQAYLDEKYWKPKWVKNKK